MIGVGVFTTSGFTLGVTGSVSNVMLCWTLGGILAVCGSIAYGQLARLMPESGGEYLYLSKTVHPLAGFLAGWVSLLAGFGGATATAAVGFERYAVPDALRPEWLPVDSLAIIVILFFALIHGRHVRWGVGIQDAVVLVKISTLVVFLIVVGWKASSHSWHTTPLETAPSGVDLISAIATSLVWISLSFAGFNAAVYVAGESEEAARHVPRALLVGTLGVTGLYLVLNFIFAAAAPADELAWQEPVAAIAAQAIGGSFLELLIRVAVSLGLASSLSGMIMSGPRVYAKMADNGVFPSFFASPERGIRRSVTLQCFIAIGLILLQRLLILKGYRTSSLLGLLIYLGTTLSVSSSVCVATLFLPSVRKRQSKRSLLIDLASGVYVLATLTSVVLMATRHEVDGKSQAIWHLSGAAFTLLSGLVAWCGLRWSSGLVKTLPVSERASKSAASDRS